MITLDPSSALTHKASLPTAVVDKTTTDRDPQQQPKVAKNNKLLMRKKRRKNEWYDTIRISI